MLTNLIMIIISQYRHTSNHHIIHPSLHNIVCQLYNNKVWGGSAPKVTKRVFGQNANYAPWTQRNSIEMKYKDLGKTLLFFKANWNRLPPIFLKPHTYRWVGHIHLEKFIFRIGNCSSRFLGSFSISWS